MTANHYSMLVLWSEGDEAFLAHVVELPGCIAHGETREEAVHNASIAIENWIDTAKELRREIPAPVDVAEFEKRTAQQAQELRDQFASCRTRSGTTLLSAARRTFESLSRPSWSAADTDGRFWSCTINRCSYRLTTAPRIPLS